MTRLAGLTRISALVVAACISAAAVAGDDTNTKDAPTYQQIVTKVPLDLALAKRMTFPTPLASLQKMLGSPGMILDPTLVPNTETHRWYSYTHGPSIGDFFTQHGQVIGLWFEAPDFSTVIKNIDGRFTIAPEHGPVKVLSLATPGAKWPPE